MEGKARQQTDQSEFDHVFDEPDAKPVKHKWNEYAENGRIEAKNIKVTPQPSPKFSNNATMTVASHYGFSPCDRRPHCTRN